MSFDLFTKLVAWIHDLNIFEFFHPLRLEWDAED